MKRFTKRYLVLTIGGELNNINRITKKIGMFNDFNLSIRIQQKFLDQSFGNRLIVTVWLRRVNPDYIKQRTSRAHLEKAGTSLRLAGLLATWGALWSLPSKYHCYPPRPISSSVHLLSGLVWTRHLNTAPGDWIEVLYLESALGAPTKTLETKHKVTSY